MIKRTKWAAAAIVLGAGVATLPIGGCDKVSEAQSAVCCTEFQVGGTVSADVSGSAEGRVLAQAVADVGGIASAAIDDLTAACRSIAQDLDAEKAQQDAAEAQTSKREKLKAWCDLAVSAIGSVKAQASATITVQVTPPVCEASVSAKANCQAQCSGEASCDLKANPPTCEGGSLEVACKGECTAKAGATLHCEGTCTGECSGSCTAEGGVDCAGKCEGTCAAKAGVGTGIQADGTCQGTCTGTCEVTAPSATCSGTCNGECSASCTGTAEASVKCDGECAADYEPLKCTGGELKGGCEASVECDANCDASVQAKAECRPPEVVVAVTASGSAELAGKLRATLEANLSIVFALRSRIELIGSVAGKIDVEAAGDVKASCIPAMLAAVGTAVEDIQVAGTASVNLTGAVGK